MGKWKMVRLGDVCGIVNGFAFDSKLFSSKQEGMPIIRIRDVVRGYTDTFTTEKYSESHLINKGDLLIGMDGEFNIAPWNSANALLNQRVCKVYSKTNALNNRYILYYLPKALKKIEEATPYVTVKHLSSKTISNIQIPLPPLPVQQNIADILDCANTIIEKRKAQIVKLDLLVKSRFVEMFGSGLNEDAVELKDVCSIITDGTHQSPKFIDSGVPFLLVSNIVNNELTYETKKFISRKEYETLVKRTPIEIGDLLLTIVGSYGNPAVVKTEQEFLFQRHIAYMKPRQDIVNSVYLHATFLSEAVKQQIEVKVKGIAQKTLNLSELKTIKIPLPPLDLQNRFSDFVRAADKSKFEMQQGLSKLELLYKSLMQKCFAG